MVQAVGKPGRRSPRTAAKRSPRAVIMRRRMIMATVGMFALMMQVMIPAVHAAPLLTLPSTSERGDDANGVDQSYQALNRALLVVCSAYGYKTLPGDNGGLADQLNRYQSCTVCKLSTAANLLGPVMPVVLTVPTVVTMTFSVPMHDDQRSVWLATPSLPRGPPSRA
ncbi:hypothetical protein [Varunaivibrio sulfuroxidans]|uniref:DUF2946 family protein n=1 Tax=Varunaivibrio sulfuroxidans TaxID=1773489 RepID=A0A4R3JDL6_9PROT|nr:hypothetical protein [Varunaivibrio sulfuroxidans]TCS63515.1 hypothetical protein EDD55_103137 [Varunaivibrio sulfuroxidans]WES30340.1 hypothetical protein P3M64_11960 [Varunaivibrio sulfuroxidans]